MTSLSKYIELNPRMKEAIEAWVSLVKSSNWEKPQDIISALGPKAVDIIGAERAVIDIKGNHLRIIVKYQFHQSLKQSVLYIKWIGTHAAYSKLCKLNKQYSVEMFK